MLPLRLFRRRNFAWANAETLTVYAGLSTLTFFLVIFLQQLAGYSPIQSGLATVPITIVMFFLSPRIGRLVDAVRTAPVHGARPVHLRRRAALAARASPPGSSYWRDLLGPLLVFSVGLSFIVAPLTSTVLADAGPSDAGIASAINNAVARVAGLLGIAIVGAAVAGSGNLLGVSGFHQAMGSPRTALRGRSDGARRESGTSA